MKTTQPIIASLFSHLPQALLSRHTALNHHLVCYFTVVWSYRHCDNIPAHTVVLWQNHWFVMHSSCLADGITALLRSWLWHAIQTASMMIDTPKNKMTAWITSIQITAAFPPFTVWINEPTVTMTFVPLVTSTLPVMNSRINEVTPGPLLSLYRLFQLRKSRLRVIREAFIKRRSLIFIYVDEAVVCRKTA